MITKIQIPILLLCVNILPINGQNSSCVNDPGCQDCNFYYFFTSLGLFGYFQCDACQPNFNLNSGNGICQCTNGYYSSSPGNCSKCNLLCSSCTGESVCTVCAMQYNRVLVNGQCICLDGYQAQNGNSTCVKKPNILLIVLSSIGSVLFCFLISFVFYRVCFARRRYEQQIHDLSANGIQRNVHSISVYMQQPDSQMQNSQTPASFWNTKQYQFRQDEICSICLDSKPLFMTDCGHYFHSKCIYSWLESKPNCPNCNKQVNARQLKRWCNKCNKVLMPVIANVSIKRSAKGKRQLVKSAPVQNQLCDNCEKQIAEIQKKQLFT